MLSYRIQAYDVQLRSADVSLLIPTTVKLKLHGDLLIQSFAPHICANFMAKKALLISFVRGLHRTVSNALSYSHEASFPIHVALCGKPGSGKSSLLTEFMKLSNTVVPIQYIDAAKCSVAGLIGSRTMQRDTDGVFEPG